MHFDQFRSEQDHQLLTSLASFNKFAEELSASNLEVEPKLELLTLVACTDDFW
jgi:hypothetical protein